MSGSPAGALFNTAFPPGGRSALIAFVVSCKQEGDYPTASSRMGQTASIEIRLGSGKTMQAPQAPRDAKRIALDLRGRGLDVALQTSTDGSPRVREAATPVAVHMPGATGVRFIRSLHGLDALRTLWDSVPSSWPAPMLGHDWIRICAEVFGLGGNLELIVAGDPPTAAIAPMFRSTEKSERLELIGANQLYEATDFVYSDSSDVTSLATALARSKLPVRLDRIPADSPVVAALVTAYRGRGVVVRRPTSGCLWIPLDRTWVNPEMKLSRHRRANLRRARRIAEREGSVSTEIISPAQEEVEPLLREAATVEAAGWKGQHGSAYAANKGMGEFFRRYAAAASERGVLRLCFLRINGRPAAMEIAVERGHRLWLLKIGYSAEFARCSPGTLLMAETIRHAAEAGLRVLEFLGADEPWIHAWGPFVRPCVSVRAYPFGIRGAFALARDLVAMTPAEARAVFRRR